MFQAAMSNTLFRVSPDRPFGEPAILTAGEAPRAPARAA